MIAQGLNSGARGNAASMGRGVIPRQGRAARPSVWPIFCEALFTPAAVFCTARTPSCSGIPEARNFQRPGGAAGGDEAALFQPADEPMNAGF